MSAAIGTLISHWEDGKKIHIIGTLTFAGNYPANGDALNLAGEFVKSMSAPEFVQVNGISKYSYLLKYDGSTPAIAGHLRIFDGATAAQIPTAAYPAGVTADVVTFHAIFPKFR